MSYILKNKKNNTEYVFETTEELLTFAIKENNQVLMDGKIKEGDIIAGSFYIEDENKNYSEVVIDKVLDDRYIAYTKKEGWEVILDTKLKQIE